MTPCSACSTLSPPSNGHISSGNVSGHSQGSPINTGTVTFTCDPGFMLEDPSDDGQRTCGILGQWSRSEPTCKRRCYFFQASCSKNADLISVINCGYPGRLENGYVEGSRSFLYGEGIRYSCRTGYQLKGGNGERICTEKGEWSGVAPKCERKTNRWCMQNMNGSSTVLEQKKN